MNQSQIRVIPLLIIVAMMAFSVRLVDFSLGVSSISGAAMAAKSEKKKEEKPTASEAKTEEKTEKEAPHDKDKKTAQKDSDEPEIDWRDAKDEGAGAMGVRMEIMDGLVERRKKLDEREKQITAREALLRAAQQELNQKFQELTQLRSQIEGLLDKQSEEEKGRVQSLVKIYEGMKPKDAARIFNTLDLDILVAVMSKMSERKLSPILASMNPERARTVTIMLAEEKKLPTLP